MKHLLKTNPQVGSKAEVCLDVAKRTRPQRKRGPSQLPLPEERPGALRGRPAASAANPPRAAVLPLGTHSTQTFARTHTPSPHGAQRGRPAQRRGAQPGMEAWQASARSGCAQQGAMLTLDAEAPRGHRSQGGRRGTERAPRARRDGPGGRRRVHAPTEHTSLCLALRLRGRKLPEALWDPGCLPPTAVYLGGRDSAPPR